MENLWLAAAGAVGQAIAQEVISRTASTVLGKRKEKASQGEYIERLEAAIRCMHSVLEKTAKAPITEVSMLRDRIELVRGYMEAKGVLNKLKKRQAHQEEQQQQEITTQAITTPSSSGGFPQAQGTSVARLTTIFSIASSFIGPIKAEPSRLSCDDIERFEWFAGRAKDFLGVVSRCAWLRCRIYFSGPLVFHLFQREILTHKILEGSREHSFCIWAIILEGRGVEADLQYIYTDHERTDKSFNIKLQLRLSHSTDIAQVAIKCLKSLAVNVKLGLLLEPATGALLQLASSQDIVSHAPRWRDPQWAIIEEKYMKCTQILRPNAVCCTDAYGYDYDNEPCAQESQFFPEEIICLATCCCISGLELTLPSPSDSARATVFGDQPPQLKLACIYVPHCMTPLTHIAVSDDLKEIVDSMLEGQKEGVAFYKIGNEYSEPTKCSIQEAAKRAIGGLFCMPLIEFLLRVFVGLAKHKFSWRSLPRDYEVYWLSKHGMAYFNVPNVVRYVLFEQGGMQLSEEQRKKQLKELEAKFTLLIRKHIGFPLGADEQEESVKSVQGNDNAGVENFNGCYNSDVYGELFMRMERVLRDHRERLCLQQ